MKSTVLTRTTIILIILIINIGCDQVSKTIVRKHLDSSRTIGLLDNHLTLLKVENTGAFLSFGTELDQPYKFIALTVFPLLTLAIGLFYLFAGTEMTKMTTLGICFFIGGGIGNLYDRILYGSVTDFLHLDFGLFQTGIFNVADLSITTGVFILLFAMFTDKAHTPAELHE
jgi:signal peptidase II